MRPCPSGDARRQWLADLSVALLAIPPADMAQSSDSSSPASARLCCAYFFKPHATPAISSHVIGAQSTQAVVFSQSRSRHSASCDRAAVEHTYCTNSHMVHHTVRSASRHSRMQRNDLRCRQTMARLPAPQSWTATANVARRSGEVRDCCAEPAWKVGLVSRLSTSSGTAAGINQRTRRPELVTVPITPSRR